jgi:hypothetical protein
VTDGQRVLALHSFLYCSYEQWDKTDCFHYSRMVFVARTGDQPQLLNVFTTDRDYQPAAIGQLVQ